MAGVAAEGMNYDEVIGQTADLALLQRILLRSTRKLSDAQQQSITRWAAYQSAILLKEYEKEYKALQEVLQRKGTMAEAIKAIESA
jgi:hypothetical protein